MNKHKTNKIIYFDKETIKNILQEKYKGSKIITSGKKTEMGLDANISLETSGEINIGVPFISRMKFLFTGKLDTKYLLKYDNTTTITSTEISDFESIKDHFKQFNNVKISDIENSSTFFRVAGGYLRMLDKNIEGVNIEKFKVAMDSFEGYDVYKIENNIYVRFNNVAFVSNYKRNDLLTTEMSIYCVPVGNFKIEDFDFMKQLQRMQDLLKTTTKGKFLCDIYPHKEINVNLNSGIQNKVENYIDKENLIKLYDVVYASIEWEGV